MNAEPEYRVEVVDAVLQAEGFRRLAHADPRTLAWFRREGDTWNIGSYRLPDARLAIRESHLLAIARQLGYTTGDQMDGLLSKIKRAGGEFLG